MTCTSITHRTQKQPLSETLSRDDRRHDMKYERGEIERQASEALHMCVNIHQIPRTDMKYSTGGTPESVCSTRSFAGHGASGLHKHEHCIVCPWNRKSVVVPFTVVCMEDDSAHGLGDSTVVTLLASNIDSS